MLLSLLLCAFACSPACSLHAPLSCDDYLKDAVRAKADSTLRSSRAVPHPSTDRALRRLTSEVRRDPVHSTRYGRQREVLCSMILLSPSLWATRRQHRTPQRNNKRNTKRAPRKERAKEDKKETQKRTRERKRTKPNKRRKRTHDTCPFQTQVYHRRVSISSALLGRGPHKNCKNDLDDQT